MQAQLDALIQTRIREDGEALSPETITVLDPACGSGHILVVAYDVLKAIYLERGYQPRASWRRTSTAWTSTTAPPSWPPSPC